MCINICIHIHRERQAARACRARVVFISEALAFDALFAINLSSQSQVAASVFVLLYQQLGQYFHFCTGQPGHTRGSGM